MKHRPHANVPRPHVCIRKDSEACKCGGQGAFVHTGQSNEFGALDSECFEHTEPPSIEELQQKADELAARARNLPDPATKCVVGELCELVGDVARRQG